MQHIYEHVFEQFRIVDPDNDSSIVDDFAGRSQWLEQPGCLFQRNNVVLGSRIRTEGVIKAGLFISVILKGAGSGRARKGASWISYSDASIVIMAFREPTLWDGDAPRGAHMQAAGVAFPVASLERLGLMDEFIDLFDARNRDVLVTSLKASPRIKAIAMEMISPVAEGRTAELLLSLAGKHSVVVVEHDMAFVRSIARTVTVLHEGSVLAEGSMDAVQDDPKVIEVYLGEAQGNSNGK